MEENKVLAYSFLAYLNNDVKGNGFNDIFIPLVKRTLSVLNTNGKNMGQIEDIKEEFSKLYKLDIPYPMLKELLKIISIEINKDKKGSMILYKDFAYVINEYTFEDYEETILYKKNKIQKLDEEFKKYIQDNATISQYEDELDLFKFIDRNRTKLSNILSENKENVGNIPDNADIEMNFIKYIKEENLELYEIMKEIYIGSIISAYIEMDNINTETESMRFIVDTNFIVSLMGLHSEEDLDTCNKIVDICHKIGYKMSIADITIQETEHILSKIIDNYDNNVIQKCRYNSTENICERKNITKTDIQLMLKNLNKFIAERKISIIYLKNKYKNESKIKNGDIYSKLKNTNYSDVHSILHDAIIIDYVSNQRNNHINNFSDVKIWFLSESKKFNNIKIKSKYPETINTNELVNLLWLIKPVISTEDIFKLGLSNLFAEVIETQQPNKRVIREIDININKYKEKINDDDIVALGSLVSDKSINKIKNINSEYEKVNELLKNGDYSEFSEKIREMKQQQDRLKEQELLKLKEKHKDEQKNEFNKFINILINNKVSECNNKILKYEYNKKQMINDMQSVKIKTEKIMHWVSTSIVIILSIIMIIYKNATNSLLKINIIDIAFCIVPILFAGIVNLKVLKIAEKIANRINKKTEIKLNDLIANIKEINSEVDILFEIKDIILKSDEPQLQINNLIKEEKYKKTVEELNIEKLIESKEIEHNNLINT